MSIGIRGIKGILYTVSSVSYNFILTALIFINFGKYTSHTVFDGV